MLDEERIFRALTRYRAAGRVATPVTDIHINLEPEDLHRTTSPDFILWLTVQLTVFAQPVRVRVPILIEAEKAGVNAALLDLDKFAERKQYRLECPFLVISNGGYKERHLHFDLPADISAREFPSRDVTAQTS